MRYTDTNLSSHRNDEFATRNRLPSLLQFLLICTSSYVIVCGTYFISQGNFFLFALITLLTMALLNGMMVWSVQRARDQMLVTEFQNALYSSALSLNNQFCLIVRRDGTLVHADAGFRALYPDFEFNRYRTLEDIFTLAEIPRDESDKLYAFIPAGAHGTHVMNMRGGDGLTQKTHFSVDPIRRMPNHVLIRGRKYVDKRNDPA